MRRFLPLILLCLAFAPAPFPRKERGPPPPQLEGLWEGGFGQKGSQWLVKITPTQMIYRPGTPDQTVCDLVLHPKASPPAYDITNRGNKWVGIYRLERDDLTLRYAYGGTRPTRFDGPEGHVVEVYKRVR